MTKENPTYQKVTDMHDLFVIHTKVKNSLRSLAEEHLDLTGNVMFYPDKPKMSDLEIISIAITAECLSIDSENLLFSKISKTKYALAA